jgi:hypothetical protein
MRPLKPMGNSENNLIGWVTVRELREQSKQPIGNFVGGGVGWGGGGRNSENNQSNRLGTFGGTSRTVEVTDWALFWGTPRTVLVTDWALFGGTPTIV